MYIHHVLFIHNLHINGWLETNYKHLDWRSINWFKVDVIYLTSCITIAIMKILILNLMLCVSIALLVIQFSLSDYLTASQLSIVESKELTVKK